MSTLNNKLDYLDETKQLIKQAIIDKGQEVSDEDTFRSYVDKISDIQTGGDTSDATATSNDILNPKTAYVNNEKITGSIIPTYSSNTILAQINSITQSLSYNLLDINYNAKIAITSSQNYRFNFCNIINNTIDYENSLYIDLTNMDTGMDGTYELSKCCTSFDETNNNLYLYLLFSFQKTYRLYGYIYNIKNKSSNLIDKYELEIDDANNALTLNMLVRPNYPNQIVVFSGYTSTSIRGSFLTIEYLQFNEHQVVELQKIEDTISTSSHQYAALVESCYFTSDGNYLAVNTRTGTMFGTTINGVIYHCTNNFLTTIVDSDGNYVSLFDNSNYIAYNQSTRGYSLFNIQGDVLNNYSGNLRDIVISSMTWTNKCILGNYLFGLATPTDFINPEEPLKLYSCKLNEDYSITQELDISIGSRTLFNNINCILYDDINRNISGYLNDSEKEIISLNRNNINYYSTKDSTADENDVLQGKIFYNSEGKQIGNKIFTDYNDSVGVLETNSSISATAVDQLIGIEMSILPYIEYLDKVKVNDIVKAVITIIDVATSSTTLKCNCLVQILEIVDHSDKQFKANIRILAADVNTEDGTATSEDIVEGKIAYVDNKRVHGTAQLGIDTSDADATSEDILAPKTAYVNGQKITGGIEATYRVLSNAMGNLGKDPIEFMKYIGNKYMLKISNSSFKVYEIDEDTNTLIHLDDETLPTNAQYNNFTVSGITEDNDFRIIFTDKYKTNNLYYYRFNIATKKIVNVGTFRVFNNSMYTNNGFKIVISKNGLRLVEYITQAMSDDTEIQLGNVSTTNITSNRKLYSASYGRECRAIQFLNNDKLINASFRVLNSQTQIENYQFILDDVYNYSTKYNTRYNYTNLAFNSTFTYCYNDNAIYTVKYEDNMYKPDTKVVDTDSSAYEFKGFVSSDYIAFNETLYKIVNPLQQIQVYNHAIDTGVVDTAYAGINLTNSVYYYTVVLDIDNQSTSIIESLDTKDGVCWNLSDVGTLEDKVLSGYKYGNYNGIKTGTMPDNGELNYEVSTTEQTIPSGYTSGGIIAASPVLQEDYDNCLNIANQILGDTNQIEYIYTENVITFNYIPNSKSRIEICAAIDGNNWNNYFGMNSTQFLLQRWGDRNEWRLFIADIQQGGDLSGIAQYEQQIVEISREGLFINKELIQSISSTDYSNISTNKQLHLNGNYPTKFKFWYMKIWEDGILVRNYQVIHLFNNQVIYDNITNTFINYIKVEEV